jgi:hypothetical protein
VLHHRPAVLAIVATLGAVGVARADTGVYLTESVGVGMSRDGLENVVAAPMHLRIGGGIRFGNIAIEPWMLTDLQTDREGAWRGFVGGEPAMGTADLTSYGVDGKYIFPIDARLSAYVRGGPCLVDANGALAGYSGYGFGGGGGFQITGRVRALGFLWSPLFFVKKGPKVTGALYLDQGYDFYRLRSTNGPPIDARIGHVSVGFALGSAF